MLSEEIKTPPASTPAEPASPVPQPEPAPVSLVAFLA